MGVGVATGLRATPAWADGVSVEASLSASETTTGQGVYLTVEVSEQGAGQRMISTPIIEVDDGSGRDPGTVRWDLTKKGARRSFAFGTGVDRNERVTSYTYLLVADRAGTYRLDVAVEVDDVRLDAKKPVNLVVAQGALPPATSGGAAEATVGQPVPPEVAGRPQVFVRHVADRDHAYVNEPIAYRYEIWQRVDVALEPLELPTFKDFYVEDLPVGQVETRSIADGTRYRVHTLMRRVLYPQRAGEIEIGPGEIKVSPRVGLGLFSRPSNKPPFTVKGRPFIVDVAPLPAESQPSGFSPNNVGRFRVESTVDRNVVEVGDGLTWTVKVSGEGNVRALDPGAWPEVPGFRVYDPKEHYEAAQADDRVGGTKTWEILLVAEAPGSAAIPAFEFPFFDPERAAYRSVKAPAIELEVSGAATTATDKDGAEGEPGSERSQRADEELLADVFTPSNLPRSRRAPEPWLDRRTWRRLSLAAPVTFAVGWAASATLRRFGPDEASRRQRQQVAWAKSRLAEARAAIEGGEGFHAAVADLLQAAAVRRAGEAGVGLPREGLSAALRSEGLPPAEVERWQALLDACDAARFGAAGGDATTRRELYGEAVALIESSVWRVA